MKIPDKLFGRRWFVVRAPASFLLGVSRTGACGPSGCAAGYHIHLGLWVVNYWPAGFPWPDPDCDGGDP
jgi:hypothetical protein